MLISGIPPAKFPIPFANSAGPSYITNPVPTPSQIGITDDAASLTDGFPPLTAQSNGAPLIGDANGILYMLSAWTRWANAGAPVFYDAAFSTAIGGYPQFAFLAKVGAPGSFWVSQVDNNITNPDTGGANWLLCVTDQASLDARYIRIAPATTYYVNAGTGSDSNNGLTGGTAFATIQHAITVASAYLTNGTITISIADGTYSGFTVSPSFISNWAFVGNVGTPGNVVISSATSGVNGGFGCIVNQGVNVSIAGMSFASLNHNVRCNGGFVALSSANIGAPSSGNVPAVSAFGGAITCTGGIGYFGSGYGMFGGNGGIIYLGTPTAALTVTVNGTPTFSGGAVVVSNLGQIYTDIGYCSFNGTGAGTGSTGPRALCSSLGLVNTGGTPNFFPGNSSPSPTSGAQWL